MRIVYFTHSLASCWNHGNAHFLRGVLRDLISRGHAVRVFEPENAWSLSNLLKDHGTAGLAPFRAAYPELSSSTYGPGSELESMCDGADLVIVHEWNDPELVSAVGRVRRRAPFTLLFHDTHHRAVSQPEFIDALDLSEFDGILAYGESLAAVYRSRGWGNRAFVWHEAADTTVFRPPEIEKERQGLVWIGNWGDGERTAELATFLLGPSSAEGIPLDLYGVRYPPKALAKLRSNGAAYRGWLPNACAPKIFSQHLATVHIPRRLYVHDLPGIPTIRVFEALACGIPLLSAPWADTEGLFRSGRDFLIARSEQEMRSAMRSLMHDVDLRTSLARCGLETISAHHTCAHRSAELMAIVQHLRAGQHALQAAS